MATIRYVGTRTKKGVTVMRERDDGRPGELPPRLDLANKSPSGFEWGYNGTGPAQLALAILADAVGDEPALRWQNYQAFKSAVVGRLPYDGWVLTIDEVLDWYRREAQPAEADRAA
jgi:hypothetical protein